MATFATQCRRCGEIFTATRSDALYCSGRCRTALYNERRQAALRDDVEAFRVSVTSILARMAEADGDPDTLAALGAEVAMMGPDRLAARRQ